MLRDYQQAAVDTAIRWVKYKGETPCILSCPTGSGKTHIIKALAEHFHAQGKRVCILAHRKKLIEQAAEKFDPLMPYSIYAASLTKGDINAPVVIASINTIYNKSCNPFSVIIADECFTGDTLILTPSGEKRIDKIKENDIVITAIGEHKVKSVFKKKTKQLLEIRLSNGQIIKCTPDHPFFTARGWIKAEKLDKGEGLFGIKELSFLWKANEAACVSGQGGEREILEQKEMLQFILRQEISKPNEQSRHQAENEGYTEKSSTSANKKRRQRTPSSSAATCITSRAWGWVASRICGKNSQGTAQWHLSESLQNRHSKRILDDCHRNKWCKSLLTRKKGAGQKENETFNRVWVESIDSIERTSNETVYNLRVAGHPSYFANGVLVHNCHRIGNNQEEGMYWQFIKQHPAASLIGMSATPYRLQGGKLGWGEIIHETPYAILFERGYLCPLINKASLAPSLSNVTVSLGDYKEDELEEVMMDAELARASITRLLQYQPDRESIMIFCVSIAHCELIKELMIANGLTRIGITHSKSHESDKDIEAFKRGELRYLISCETLLEGFDAPNVDMILCLRPTKSKGLWEQMLGRGCRTAEGKTDCLLLDMAGNLAEHGGIGTPYKEPSRRETQGAKGRICPECETWHEKATIKECSDCGFQFPEPERPKVGHSYEPDMTSEAVYIPAAPVVVRIVDMNYRKHLKKGTTDKYSIRVEYFPNREDLPYGGSISEWISPHNESAWARENARAFMLERNVNIVGDMRDTPMDELVRLAGYMKAPYALKVDTTSGKYPQIKGYVWESPENKKEEIVMEELLDDFIPF